MAEALIEALLLGIKGMCALVLLYFSARLVFSAYFSSRFEYMTQLADRIKENRHGKR